MRSFVFMTIAISLLSSISCKRILRKEGIDYAQSKLIDDLRHQIAEYESISCSCNIVVGDSSLTRKSNWLEDVDKIVGSIGYEVYDELIDDYNEKNKLFVANKNRVIKYGDSNFGKLNISNFGFSKKNNYIIFYQNIYFGPLNTESSLKICLFDSASKKIVYPPIYNQVISRS